MSHWINRHDSMDASAQFITDYDLYLFNEGNHHRIYEKLGAHPMVVDGRAGTHFAVWAPNAKSVSMVCNRNHWDGRADPLKPMGSSGVWAAFVPDTCPGELYKYEIRTQSDDIILKADPCAFYSEMRPGTASIVCELDTYQWNDDEWMKSRDAGSTFDKPVSIYEVHLGSWARADDNRFLTYRELADKLVSYAREMGYTHIELLPVSEHPSMIPGATRCGLLFCYQPLWVPGRFLYLVDRCHYNGFRCDHRLGGSPFPERRHGLARFDGTALWSTWTRAGSTPTGAP